MTVQEMRLLPYPVGLKDQNRILQEQNAVGQALRSMKTENNFTNLILKYFL
jgi:hypothetical protein